MPVNAPAVIEPDRQYRVDLTRAVTVSGIRLKPRGEVTLRGDLLAILIEEDPDAVVAAIAV